MIKHELWDNQKTALAEIKKTSRRLLNIDVGRGKTLLALSLFDWLKSKNTHNVNVVLCPKSGLVSWENEITSSTDFTYSVNDFNSEVDVNIITFPNIELLYTAARDIHSTTDSCLFVDEAHALCSADSKLAVLCRGHISPDTLGNLVSNGIISRFKRAYGLTATIMGNHIDDLFYILSSIFPALFKNLESFMNDFTIRETRMIMKFDPLTYTKKPWYFKEVVGYKNLDKLSDILNIVVYREPYDYNPTILTHYVYLTSEELDLYYTVGSTLLKKSKSIASELPKLQAVVNGSVDITGQVTTGLSLSSKERQLVTVLNNLLDSGEGAVVFTQLRQTTLRRLEVMRNFIRAGKIVFLSSTSNDKQRASVQKDLDTSTVLFATRVGGTSLNLQAVNNVVLYDIDWDCIQTIQMIGRITRTDSVHSEFKVHLLLAKNTIDEYKYFVLQHGLSLQSKLVGGFSYAQLYFQDISKEMLLSLRQDLISKRKKNKPLPDILCTCGKHTSQVLSEWCISDDGVMIAKSCIVCWDTGTDSWIPGCGKDSYSPEMIQYVDNFLRGCN